MINHIKYYKDIYNETSIFDTFSTKSISLPLYIIKRLLEILLEIKTTINKNILEIDNQQPTNQHTTNQELSFQIFPIHHRPIEME